MTRNNAVVWNHIMNHKNYCNVKRKKVKKEFPKKFSKRFWLAVLDFFKWPRGPHWTSYLWISKGAYFRFRPIFIKMNVVTVRQLVITWRTNKKWLKNKFMKPCHTSGIPEAETFGQKRKFSAFGLRFRPPKFKAEYGRMSN